MHGAIAQHSPAGAQSATEQPPLQAPCSYIIFICYFKALGQVTILRSGLPISFLPFIIPLPFSQHI